MSTIVSTWVLEHCEESVPGRRLVLLVLADKADHDGTSAYPSVARIAHETRMSERGVRYALRELERAGRIQKRGLHPMYGTNEYAVMMEGGQSLQGGNSRAEGGQTATETGRPIAPDPSVNPSNDNRPQTAAPASDEWPEGIKNPTAADAIFAVVDGMAREHGARVVTKRALGHAMLSAPGRDFIGEAHRMASYYVGRRVRDAVATYRNWLGKAEERYAPPVGVAASAPATQQFALVRGGRRDAEAERLARQARRAAVVRGESA